MICWKKHVTICVPPYASIFKNKIKSQILNHAPHSIHFWRRFIDDCFFIFTHREDKLHKVPTFMNAIHPTIKFTFKYSKTSIDLLDTSIYIRYLVARGYHNHIINSKFTEATTLSQTELLSTPSHNKKKQSTAVAHLLFPTTGRTGISKKLL